MRQVSTFWNQNSEPLKIAVEPLGEVVELLPQDQCHVLLFGDRTEPLDVAFSGDYVSVYSHRHCDVAVFKNGQRIAGPMWTADGSQADAEYQSWLTDYQQGVV